MEICFLLLAGAAGAVVKDVLKDNCLVMPKLIDGKLTLGFLGGVFIGAAVGYLVDGDPFTAFLGGFAGFQILESLIPKEKKV